MKPVRKHSFIDSFVRRMSCPQARADELTEAIVDMIALDLRPVSTVNGVGFRRLMYKAEPAYRVPSATNISLLLRKKHGMGLDLVKEKLQASAVRSVLFRYRLTCGQVG